MFFTLLIVTFGIAFGVSALVARAFTSPIDQILRRIIADDVSLAWLKYLKFAILVVGVSAGARIHDIEKYITPSQWQKDARIVELTYERWILELYRTVIETLQGIAWMLLVFFIFALVAYVIVRFTELREKQG